MQIATRKPYLPLIVVDPAGLLPENAIPFALSGGNPDRLAARLRAALRTRALHSTVLRRLADECAGETALPDVDCARDATVLLIGRGGSYPALSVALGECMGVVGAFNPVQTVPAGRLLLGFSKSGWGAFSLLLRHPDVFGRAAAWDAPLMMNKPGPYGSGDIFGTPENFARYQIRPSEFDAWQSAWKA